MKQNIGKSGRIVRLLFALILLALAYLYWSWPLLLASLFVFYESLAGWCVVYHFLGKNSCTNPKNRKS